MDTSRYFIWIEKTLKLLFYRVRTTVMTERTLIGNFLSNFYNIIFLLIVFQPLS